jgi:hypothetical protein
MANIPVLVVVNEHPAKGGVVKRGASPTTAQSAVGTAIQKAIEITLTPEKLVAGVKQIAQDIGPILKEELKGLGNIAVQEVSIGCAINASGGILVAGVGAEASLTITFKVS